MIVEPTYQELQHPMRRHIRGLLGLGQQLPPSLLEQERRLEHRIRTSGLTDRLIHLLAGVQDSQTRANEPFEIFVMGEGKHGKSTFINAVLGEHIAPTDWLPKTWCFNRYIAVDEPDALVRLFVDPILLESAGSSEIRQHIGTPVGKFRNLVEFHVSRNVADAIAESEERRVAHTLGSSKPYFSPVMEIEWAVAARNALLPGIRLVDTMGINQQLAPSSHLHHLKWQYERADAVIWIVAAEKIGAKELRNEMLEARRYSKQLILIINKWDQLDDSTRKRALTRAEREYGELVSSVIPMSSLAALYARQGLPSSPSDDELAWARANADLDVEEVLQMSGLPLLQENLVQFLDGRQQLTKNLQTYSALRQKGAEFRSMVSQARSDAEANIQLHHELMRRTADASSQTQAQMLSNIKTLESTSLAKVRSGIQAVDYDSRERARSLMQLEAINNDLRMLAQNEALNASAKYADIITWLASSSQQYRESHFDATGRVADSIATLCTTRTNVKVEPGTISWQIPDPNVFLRDLLIGVGQFFSGLPLFGGMIQEKVRQAKEKATNDIRRALERDVVPQVKNFIDSTRARLVEANDQVARGLEEDMRKQFELTGGESTHQMTIANADEALSGPAVEPLLIALPIRTMRRLGWRQS